MNKKPISVISVLASVFVAVALIWSMNYSWHGNKKTDIEINGQKITAEMVSTRDKMEKGLSGRKVLCEKCGMLFLLGKKGIYSFWMKEMNFDLDIIWIDGKSIVNISRNVPADFPGTMKNELPADKVLELPAGFSDKYGIDVGDNIGF